jgi:hypothetical protein
MTSRLSWGGFPRLTPGRYRRRDMKNESIPYWPSGYTPPHWLPNWRDETEYPVLGGTSKEQYAWEFLRRNPSYQIDYLSMCELCEREGVAERYLKPLGLNIFTTFDETPITSMQFHAALYRTLRKWGLAFYLLDPSVSCHDTANIKALGRLGEFNYSTDWRLYSKRAMDGIETVEEIPIDGGIIPEGGETPWLFDIYQPVTSQIERVKEWLESVQKEVNGGKKLHDSRYELEKFNLYLRVLDADAHKESNEEITSVLFPGEAGFSYFNTKGKLYDNDRRTNHGRNTLRNNRNAAYRLRDNGYKLLL